MPLRVGIVLVPELVVDRTARTLEDVPLRVGIVRVPEPAEVTVAITEALVPVLLGIVLEPDDAVVNLARVGADVPVRSGIVLEPDAALVSATSVLADVPVTGVISGANRISLLNSIQGAASAVPVSSSVASVAFSPNRRASVNDVATVLTARPPTSMTNLSPDCAVTGVSAAPVDPTGNRAFRAAVAVVVLTHSLIFVVVLSCASNVPRTVEPSEETTRITICERALAPVALSRARIIPLTVPLMSWA